MTILTACKLNTSTNRPFPDLTEWDLLIISDSSNWGVGQYYAKLIEVDMNVKVNLHDCWVGGLSIKMILQNLQSGRTWSSSVDDTSCQKPLTDLVKEAEVIVLYGNPLGAKSAAGSDICMLRRYQDKIQSSDFEIYKEQMLASCSPENWDTFKANIGAVIDEIYAIREGRPLILRMTDQYIPLHSNWIQDNVDEVCTACVGSSAEAIRKVAKEHGVLVADTMVAFNGEDYKSDPPAEYFRSDDHLSDAGAQFVATVLQQTGYEYAGM